MPRRKRRRSRLEELGADVLSMVTSAREASKIALQRLRKEIIATKNHLEKLLAEEPNFRLTLVGTGSPGRPRTVSRSRTTTRPAGRRATARKVKPRRKRPPKADEYFAKLPGKFTIDDVRKLAGKATGVSLAQRARAKKVKKTAAGYQKVA